MSTRGPVLEVDRLSVAFRSGGHLIPALREVSLALDAGKMLAVVGESGAGKSLLCRSICGLNTISAQVTAGVIRVAGKLVDPNGGASMRELWGKRLAMVFQDPRESLNPVRTIGSQLTETLRLHHGLTGREASGRALGLLEEVGLPEADACAKAYPHELSGGMCQRAAIAIALSPRPDLLVADEPTSALDAVKRREILQLLVDRCRIAGTALLLVTHDLLAARSAADSVAVLYAGEVVEIGPANAVLEKPLHPFTQGLLRSAPTLGERKDRLEAIDGLPPSPGEARRGCAFAPRCGQALAACFRQAPEACSVASSRVKCLLHGGGARRGDAHG